MKNFEFSDRFVNRHIGPRQLDINEMLEKIGIDSIESLMNETIPENIRIKEKLKLNEPLTENPIKQGNRKYPIDFTYSFGKRFKSIITIPQGYKIEYIPESLKTNNIHISMEYQVINLDSTKILVTGLYTFKKPIYEAEDITSLKLYFNDIIKKFNEKIVLVKE